MIICEICGFKFDINLKTILLTNLRIFDRFSVFVSLRFKIDMI
jgi:hypothetical protein